MVTKEVLDQYEATIGIECHAQLKTKTKLFSGADNDARAAAPNTTVSPICFGLPGVLPVLNAEAVTLAIRAGIALNAKIAPISSFDRKHYFYPDLPMGYQITQLERPIVGIGEIDVPQRDGTSKKVRITRAHLESDAGKLTHPTGADYSLVDLNRAGTPLIEIVSEADMHSPEEAKAFAQELHMLMTYAEVTDGDLYHGNMRFDVNISVAKKGASWGTRAEIKNLNSFKSVEKAAEYEFTRQIERLEKGEVIVQETRGWHDDKQKTFSQRSKEDAQDYRYFPDADIPPIEVTPERIEEIKNQMKPLPPEIRSRLAELDLNSSQINAILSEEQFANQMLAIMAQVDKSDATRIANWFTGEIVRIVSELDFGGVKNYQLTTDQLIELSAMVRDNKLSSTGAKDVLAELMLDSKLSAQTVAESKNLLQMSDSSAIEAIVDAVLADAASQKAIEDIRAGNDKVIGFLVGQVMKKSQGKANPALATNMIKNKIGA